MLVLLEQGGPVLWVIAAIFAAAAVIAVDRFYHLQRATLRGEDFLPGILRVLGQGNTFEAATLCEEAPGPVAHLAKTAVLHAGDDLPALRQAIEEAGLQEVPRLERGLPLLGVFAHVLPLLGLLGTVTGLITLLADFEAAEPLVFSSDLVRGMREALVTTGAGLGGAILVHVAVHYLYSRVERLILDMERATGEILGFMARRSLLPTESPAP